LPACCDVELGLSELRIISELARTFRRGVVIPVAVLLVKVSQEGALPASVPTEDHSYVAKTSECPLATEEVG
jgi:hypothetical protein